jgi:hypothetical protein
MPIQFDPFVASQGLAAGLSGKLPEFLQTQNQKRQIDVEQQKQDAEMQSKVQESQFKDAYAAQQLLANGDYDGIVKLGITRLTMLQGLNADPAETQRVLKIAIAARNGNDDAKALLKGSLDSAVKVGTATGVLKFAEKKDVKAVNPQDNIIDPTTGEILRPGTPKAEDKFVPLTPEEEAKYNPKGDRFFQKNSISGKIEQVGSPPSTNITLPAGAKSLDTYFANNVAGPWLNGGQVQVTSNIASLTPVVDALIANKGAPLTGAVIGNLPKFYKTFTPAGVANINAKQTVEQVVQTHLKEILGPQFTAMEGDNLIKRAYDETLPPQENAQRLQKLLAAMQIGADQKQAQVDYFMKNNTIEGFKGKMPTLKYFMDAVDGSGKEETDPMNLFPNKGKNP